MYGPVAHTQSKRDLALEYQAQIQILRPSIHARRANLTVKFQDLYGFTVEGNVDDVNVLNEVREKVRQQGRVWWSLEASKGANWYLETQVSTNLKLSTLGNAIALKRLIRKGIPPALRPKVWFALSGAAKKKSTVPDSYYDDLIAAVQGKVTAATKQIDHVSSSSLFKEEFFLFIYLYYYLDDFMKDPILLIRYSNGSPKILVVITSIFCVYLFTLLNANL